MGPSLYFGYMDFQIGKILRQVFKRAHNINSDTVFAKRNGLIPPVPSIKEKNAHLANKSFYWVIKNILGRAMRVAGREARSVLAGRIDR